MFAKSKAVLFSICLAAAQIFSPALFAQTDAAMLDSLVSRGILRADDARDLAKQMAGVYAEASKAKKITLSSYIQTTFEYMTTNSDTRPETKMFDLRRLYITLRVNGEADWGLNLNCDAAASNYLGPVFIWKKFDTDFAKLKLDFGYSKPTFIYEQNLSASNQFASERSIVNYFWCRSFNQTSTLGMGGFMLGSFLNADLNAIKGASVSLALTNATNNTISFKKAPASVPVVWLAGKYRAGISEDTSLTVMLNSGYGAESNYMAYSNTSEKAAIMMLNPGLLLASDNYRVNADFVISSVEKGKFGGATATPLGAIANFEYFFDCRQIGKLAPVFRYAWLNSNGRGFGADKVERHLRVDSADTPYNSAQSFYLGVNWYITGDNRLKLQIGYERVRYSGRADSSPNTSEHNLNENAVKCLMQAMF